MAERTAVHGFWVTYEQNAYDGIKYLRDDLKMEETRVFFDQARVRGSAQFEDDHDRQFTVLYHSGNYTLVRR